VSTASSLWLTASLTGLAGACAGPRHPSPGDDATVELLAAHGGVVQVLEAAGAGLHVARTVTTPGWTIDGLAWGAGDPAVLIDADASPSAVRPFDADVPPPSAHPSEFGSLTQAGYVAWPALPPATWDVPHKQDAEALTPEWDLTIDRAGALWQQNCAWGLNADGRDICEAWAYARRAPPPVVVTSTAPSRPPEHALPPLAPTADPVVALVHAPGREPDVKYLTCRTAGVTVEFPDAEERVSGFLRVEEPRWISRQPPIFAVEVVRDGFVAFGETSIFEGCKPSARYTAYVVGPHDTVALYGAKVLTVLRRGATLGTLDGADRVAFRVR
jgi:hypothetical protein